MASFPGRDPASLAERDMSSARDALTPRPSLRMIPGWAVTPLGKDDLVLDDLTLPVAGLVLLLGYLLGSIPFGLLLTRFGGTVDLRSIGSGNIGATNVLRTGRKDLAAATLLLDGLKGTAAVLIGIALGGPIAALVAAIGAFLGHVFPAWLRFRGGKGVATYLGCLLGVAWPAGLAFIAAWLVVAFATRYSSLSAFVASAIAPTVLAAEGARQAAVVFLALSVLLWITHRANIARLMAGTEGKIGKRA